MRCRSSPTIAILGLALALPVFHGAWAQAARPLHPQAPPPTIQLAAAPENEFDGEWAGTFAGEAWCDRWNILLEATVKDGEFSTVVTAPGEIQNKLEGSVSNDGQLSFWDRID